LQNVKELLASRREGSPHFVTAAMWPSIFAPDPAASRALGHPDGRIITDAASQFPDTFEESRGLDYER